MPEFKKQHFLPASYLKYFSDDPTNRGRSSFVWRIDESSQRRVPVESQCHGKYFYSKTNRKQAETSFHRREARYCKIIDALLAGTEPAERIMGDLFLCMFDLNLRNAIHENRTNQDGFDAYQHRLNMFLAEMLVGGEAEALTINATIQHISANWRMEIILAPETSQFITSDHPSVFMTCSTPTPDPKKALQMILLPLSPNHTAIAFDRRYISLRKATANRNDMETLNVWQIFNSNECIYTNAELKDEDVAIFRGFLTKRPHRECAIDERGWKLYTSFLPHESHFSFMSVKPT